MVSMEDITTFIRVIRITTDEIIKVSVAGNSEE